MQPPDVRPGGQPRWRGQDTPLLLIALPAHGGNTFWYARARLIPRSREPSLYVTRQLRPATQGFHARATKPRYQSRSRSRDGRRHFASLRA